MMNKDKKTFVGIILLLISFTIFVSILAFQEQKAEALENEPKRDALLFKEEYESLNGKVREKDGKKIKEISIDSNNPITILTEEEAINLLENGTGLIYMGFPDCPWCRSMLPVLLQTLDNMNISVLSYLNILDIRDTYILDEENKPVQTKNGTESYYKMLTLLDPVLKEYTLKTEKGKSVSTKEKRIYAPTVIGVKNGEIVGIHEGTVDSQTDPYENLSTKQQEELAENFIELVNKVYDINCDEAC